jgi:type VI protein secretion system component VasK
MASPLLRLTAIILLTWLAAVPAALLPAAPTTEVPSGSEISALLARALGLALVPMGAGVIGVLFSWRRPRQFRVILAVVLTISALLFLTTLRPWS